MYVAGLFLFMFVIFGLQHDFVKGCTDTAPIRALIAEFKAEVIEEEEKLNAEEELKVSQVPSNVFSVGSPDGNHIRRYYETVR